MVYTENARVIRLSLLVAVITFVCYRNNSQLNFRLMYYFMRTATS
jgi:hypothetical protein